MSGESGNPFGDMVKDVATRERAKSETLDAFGELCVIEERIHALLNEAVPNNDWTPPNENMVGLGIAMERLNKVQASYRARLENVRYWALREAQDIRNRLRP